MLFDSRLSTPGVLVLAAIATVARYALLSAIAAPLDWDRVSAQSWITTTTLDVIGLLVILHVAVWRRWPVAASRTPST
jgi:hypothetical protein